MLENGRTSRLPNFYKLSLPERHEVVNKIVDLTREERWMLKKETLTAREADAARVISRYGKFATPRPFGKTEMIHRVQDP